LCKLLIFSFCNSLLALFSFCRAIIVLAHYCGYLQSALFFTLCISVELIPIIRPRANVITPIA
jgi:hypothetical protein